MNKIMMLGRGMVMMLMKRKQ